MVGHEVPALRHRVLGSTGVATELLAKVVDLLPLLSGELLGLALRRNGFLSVIPDGAHLLGVTALSLLLRAALGGQTQRVGPAVRVVRVGGGIWCGLQP